MGIALAVITLGSSSCIWDVNQDGTIVIACLGDSNTWPFSGHCESIAAANPGLSILNYAVPGTSAGGGPPDGGVYQIARAKAGDPANGKLPADIVVLAFGTHDIGGNGSISPMVMADRIDVLKAAAAELGMPAFVASIPPRVNRRDEGAPCVANPGATPVINAANYLIQQRTAPLWFIDYHTGFSCPAHFISDGVHINAAGGALRAERMAERLFYVPPSAP
jgi:lysophospholipase L1-like esterase